MRKLYNFSAGPATLPEEVLLQAQSEMLDWNHTGLSIMEISHRSAEFNRLAEQCEADLRELMAIPSNYRVLFLAGGATTQFSMIPMNLLATNPAADYLHTGYWSKKAIAVAERLGNINIAAQTIAQPLQHIPDQAHWQLNPDAAYVHMTTNETIDGIDFHRTPQTGHVPLVADMSSMILSRPIDVSAYGLIYACAQKNLGQAGITVVIIRDDLVNDPQPFTPALHTYKVQVAQKSCYNTPPTYAWYILALVLAWLKRQGGAAVMAKRNAQKAQLLYQTIDKYRGFYINTVDPIYRSQMNGVFQLKNQLLTQAFITEAAEAGLVNLKGHQAVGGVRASLYNAMPLAGVVALSEFMHNFAIQYG